MPLNIPLYGDIGVVHKLCNSPRTHPAVGRSYAISDGKDPGCTILCFMQVTAETTHVCTCRQVEGRMLAMHAGVLRTQPMGSVFACLQYHQDENITDAQGKAGTKFKASIIPEEDRKNKTFQNSRTTKASPPASAHACLYGHECPCNLMLVYMGCNAMASLCKHPTTAKIAAPVRRGWWSRSWGFPPIPAACPRLFNEAEAGTLFLQPTARSLIFGSDW